KASHAAKMLKYLPIANRLASRAAEWPGGCLKLAHFVQQPGGKHRLHATIDPLDQLLSWPNDREHPTCVGPPGSVKLLLQVRNGLAGLLVDFQGSDHPAAVASMQSPGTGRVHRSEPPVKGLVPFPLGNGLEFAPQVPICRR